MSIETLCDIIQVRDLTEGEWLAERKKGIGGSDIGTICGLNKYKSPYALWAEKTGLVIPEAAGQAAALGTALEGPVADLWAKENKRVLVEWPVILRSKEHPHMLANVDRFIVETDQPSEPRVIQWTGDDIPPGIVELYEGKTTAIASPGAPHEWFQEDGIPWTYQLQCLWYLAITGLSRVYIGALVGGHGLITRVVERDEEVIGHLLDIGYEFQRQVEEKEPPAVDGSESTERALKQQFPRHTAGKAVEGGNELANAWIRYRQLKEDADEIDKKKKEAYQQIVEILGDAEVGLVDGERWMTYKANRDREVFDQAAFLTDHPEMTELYVKKVAGFRVLREVKG